MQSNKTTVLGKPWAGTQVNKSSHPQYYAARKTILGLPNQHSHHLNITEELPQEPKNYQLSSTQILIHRLHECNKTVVVLYD